MKGEGNLSEKCYLLLLALLVLTPCSACLQLFEQWPAQRTEHWEGLLRLSALQHSIKHSLALHL